MIELARTNHFHITMTGYLIGASVLSLLFGLIGTWSLWRVLKLLAVVPQIQDRLSVVSNSVSLLVDTTEACFKAVSIQLQTIPTQSASPKAARAAIARAARISNVMAESAKQRRVLGAAKRGESVRDIAAREHLAESEVALRLRVPREQEQDVPSDGHGPLFS